VGEAGPRHHLHARDEQFELPQAHLPQLQQPLRQMLHKLRHRRGDLPEELMGLTDDPPRSESAFGDEQLRKREELEALGPQAIALIMQEARVVVGGVI
jgi:hypothetical protein